MANIEGKVVVITGASSGIGEATAKLLAANGAKVVLGARRDDRLKELKENIGQNCVYAVTDVTSLEDVQALGKLALNTFGRIDAWMNNAGVMPQSTLDKLHTDEWNQMIDVNIKGVLNGIATALPQMRKQCAGHIINISSIAAHGINVGGAVYSATKAAVNMISETLRQEEAVAGSNVRVSIVSPGAIATELTQTITDTDLKGPFEELYDAFAISPARIAETILFALNQPEDVTVNEFIVRPSRQQP
ncbi:SDR family oxidoreductase [Peribacillus frigoritolerans]|uniref:SDR family oxidoreductase n=1 Tax=Peribacillus frigoritolerans TaxID=450367 RepID=UPI0025A17E98|nr:SDR family oxidoreductase [Peribacillus frigoritolerans]MDM5314264.1 SDR family oxidoreductase [Peribacillus frigoritolerans]